MKRAYITKDRKLVIDYHLLYQWKMKQKFLMKTKQKKKCF